MDDVENIGFYRKKDFINLVGMAPGAWSNGVKRGQLPPKYNLSVKDVGYLKEDIILYLKFKGLYKRPKKNQTWEDIKKLMSELHP